MGTMAHLGRMHVGLRGQAHTKASEELRKAGLEQFRHDLRQPLATISLLLEHVADTPTLESAALARIRESQRQVSWAFELLRAQEVSDEVIGLVEIGHEVADVVPLLTGLCDIRLLRPSRAYVRLERLELVRAAHNLLDNAVHAATSVPGSATVQVTVDRQCDQAVMAFDDSGPGFGRVEPRHGLGLDSVRRFAERWGGSLTCGMSPLGGACVELRLPVATRRRSR